MLTNGGKVAMYGTPIPNGGIERREPANSEVDVYTLSPEELEEIRNKYPAEKLAYKKPSTVKVSIDEYWERKKRDKPIEIGRLTKQRYAELRDKGLSDVNIMTAAKMPYSRLNKLKQKWGLIKVTHELV